MSDKQQGVTQTAMQEFISDVTETLNDFKNHGEPNSEYNQGAIDNLELIIDKATELLAKEAEDKKNEAIAFSEWIGEQGLFNGLSPDNIRRWHKMVGNSKARTSKELYKDFTQTYSQL